MLSFNFLICLHFERIEALCGGDGQQ